MKAQAFYGHFAAAYGTCWLVMWILSLLTQSSISAGQIGYWGFPIVGVCYALFRSRPAPDVHQRIDDLAGRLARLEAQHPLAPHHPPGA